MKNKSEKIKVEMVYESYPYTYPPFKNFLEFLKKENKLNIGITVFKKEKNTPKNVSFIPNLKIRKLYEIVYSIQKKYRNLKYPQLFWLRNKVEIVHLQQSYQFNHIVPLLNYKSSHKPKVIISLVGGDSYVKPWVSSRWTDFYTTYGNKVDAYTVQSHDQKEYIKKWGIDIKNIFVIPVSFGNISKAKPKYPNTEKLKLVSAFRMTWEKNIEGSIRFAKKLKDLNILFEYDIYGDGDDLGQLYYLVDKFDLKENVFIKGRVDNQILKDRLVAYDFFLQLSISEALSASVIEAQSFGLPCIVSNSDGIKEAIIPNVTGVCGDYYDLDYFVTETLKLWKDKEKYFQFSEKAIQYVNENFSLEKEVERTMIMYNEILNR